MQSRILLSSLIFCVVSTTTTVSEAQINTEKLRSKNATEGVSGNVGTSVILRQGNVNRLRVDASFRVQHETLQNANTNTATTGGEKTTKQLMFIVGELTFAEKDTANGTEVFINRSFTHARYGYMIWPSFGPEVFSQIQYNQSIRLQFRALGGLGLRWAAFESEFADLYLGSGYMFEHEVLDVAEPNVETNHHRLTNYASLSVKLLDNKIGLLNTAYIQPRVDELSDYRFISDSILSFVVTKNLSLGVVFNLRYDSEPPPEVEEKLDIELKNTIRFSF